MGISDSMSLSSTILAMIKLQEDNCGRSFFMILQSGGITELRRQIRTIQTSNTNAQRKHFGLVKTQFGSKKNWLPCHKVTCIMQTVVL
ncbi:hypothetical protein BDL97_13G001600 [Sphagnum fallax]|nr:hypothetical protein BDL97_13G001600 [Sphagnum fallax]